MSIEGVSGRAASNVRNRLSIYAYHQQTAPGASRLRYLHEMAYRDIRAAVTPYGFYQMELDSSLELRDGVWQANYRITLGPAITIADVDIQVTGAGANDSTFPNLINRLNIRPNAQLLHADYERAKSRLRSLAAERGYYEARFAKQELRIDLESYTASIVIELDSGPRYRFGKVTFTEGHLDNDVMERFVDFDSGDYISSNALLELQLGLSDSDYFNRVEVQPLWQEADDEYRVPVEIDYEPILRTNYQTGIGYGTDTGARLRFDLNRRWVNSRGHRFNSQIQLSEALSSVAGSYIIPGRRPQTDQYAVRGLWTDEDTGNTESERVSLGVSWQTQLNRTQRILAVDWLNERDRLDGERRDSSFLLPSAQWTRVHTENRLNVDDGFRLALTVRGAAERVFSDADFAQATLSAKIIHRMSERWRFLSRGEAGTSMSSDFDKIPTSLRFYAGGDTSIRGYSYRSVGPRNDMDEVTGARHLLTGSLEVDYEFRTNWRFAVFVDSGNAFDDIAEPMKTGAGFGLRWQSPIGPVRIDLAHAFSDPGDAIRLHLTIGPDL
ncbi:autotransporter assembly complex protein TamA [Aliidiomarina shirensis]|uniref:autotransporter assembly complex protein TamA n=1 Tax=Aliidiomarina shirensis TaxID=1048642 RepID=UPI0018E52803|nr:autotransporter assembly complex family protein [Aliidiomarina shirensis]